MNDVALYFPHVGLPSDSWVKAAALHWPQLGRIRPRGYYGLQDSDTVKQLHDELDFIVDVEPGWGPASGGLWVDEVVLDRLSSPAGYRDVGTQDQIDALFLDFLDRHKDDLTPRYGARVLGLASLVTQDVYDDLLPLNPVLQEVHPGKVSWRLAQRLEDAGLLISRRYWWRRAEDGRVLHVSDQAMHHRLAGAYLAILADVVARENGMTPVTDLALFSPATSGWTVEALARMLLSDDNQPAAFGREDYSTAFAVLAIQTVVPRDLARVPVARIIEARRRLLPQLLRYRQFLDSLAPDFVDISAIRDPAVRAIKLRNHVESNIAQPLEAMERELGRLGLQPVRAVLSLQTLAPPTAMGVLANAVRLPDVVTSAGVAAGCLVGAMSSAFDQRRQTLAGHPSGYLLSLRHELGPSDAVAQVRSAVRRALPRRRSRTLRR